MSLPLLSLPYVVLDNVSKQIGLQELYLLSTLTKRTKRLVSSFKNKHLKLKLDDDSFHVEDVRNKDHIKIHLDSQYENVEKGRDQILGEEWVALQIGTDSNMTTYHRNKNLTFFKILEHLLETFNLSKTEIGFFNRSADYVRKLIGILKDRKVQLMKVMVYRVPSKSKSPDKSLLAILEECNHAKRIEVGCQPTPNFKLALEAPLEVDEVHIVYNWVTNQNIIDYFMNCRSVVLEECRFSMYGLRDIILRWMQGSRIEHFELADPYDRYVPEVIRFMKGASKIQRAKVSGMNDRDLGIGGFYIIKQVTGRKAIVFNYRGKLFLITDFDLTHEESEDED